MSADERSGAPSGERAQNGARGGTAGNGRAAWWIYRGTGRPLPDIDLGELLPEPPPWRAFDGGPLQPPPPADDRDLDRRLGPAERPAPWRADPREVDAVNAALFLRRPLLVTGKPGVGKSSLAYRVARELRLGRVLRWPISSRSTLRDGLYEYDPIGRAQDAAATRRPAAEIAPDETGTVAETVAGSAAGAGIGDYLRLGSLGTALLPYQLPRVLLIDELDKSDIDLPNDLLDVFEEGEYRIPELVRVSARNPRVRVHTSDPEGTATVAKGQVRCRAFPLIIITSNGEREFPPAFLRRCLRFTMVEPDESALANMVAAHFTGRSDERTTELVRHFLDHRSEHSELAADQLLNAVFLATSGARTTDPSWSRLLELVWTKLSIEAAPE